MTLKNPNTFKDYLHGTTKKWTTPFPSGSWIHLSELGFNLPAHEDQTIKAELPGMPTFMSLLRQMELHIVGNAQGFTRIVKFFREQSDCVMLCRECDVQTDYNVISGWIYEKWEDAEAGKTPGDHTRKGGMDKFKIMVAHSDLHHDSHYFARKDILNFPRPGAAKKLNLMEVQKNV
jgi:hypothetical protein